MYQKGYWYSDHNEKKMCFSFWKWCANLRFIYYKSNPKKTPSNQQRNQTFLYQRHLEAFVLTLVSLVPLLRLIIRFFSGNVWPSSSNGRRNSWMKDPRHKHSVAKQEITLPMGKYFVKSIRIVTVENRHQILPQYSYCHWFHGKILI